MTSIYETPGPYISQAFPAPGLRDIVRNITTHNAEGKGIFLPASNAAYDSPMANGHAINNVVYNTTGFPTDLNDEKDIQYSSSNEPGLMEPNGTLVRYIDFAPGAASNPHRALCIGYGVVLEGTLELELDSGEKRLLQRGDISVNRATVHTWTNMSKTEPARVLFFLLPIEPLKVNGKIVGQEMGRLGESYKK